MPRPIVVIPARMAAQRLPGKPLADIGGLRDQVQRANLIAWMREQGSTGYAIPAPDPARQAGAAPAEGEATAEGDALPGATEVEGTQGAEPVEDPGARGGQAADAPNMELSSPGGPANAGG